jgi:catechol 2,3-dioxygenase-like lactoylglutathione lyase family enzyme
MCFVKARLQGENLEPITASGFTARLQHDPGGGSAYTSPMKILGASSVLQVSDLETAVKFYRDVLGFEVAFRYGNYAGVCSGDFSLHLCAHHVWKRPVGGGALFIYCDEVDQYCEEIRSRGAVIRGEPADQEYGMRDFVVSDPDGNVLTFGRSSPPN